MNGAALLARVRLVLPALGCLFLALVALYSASKVAELRCERSEDACTWRTESVFGSREHAFSISSVREVRFVDDLGKHGGDAETTLVFARGTELRLLRDDHAAARVRFEAIRAFFAAGAREPALEQREHGAWWRYLLALGLGICAAVLGVRGWRAPTPGERNHATAWWARNRRAALMGMGLVLLLAVVALAVPGSNTQGTLELDCRTRCRFQGAECLPGGSLETTLDPGTYTIEVWAASGPARWTPRTFTIEVGETTQFVCRP